MQTWWKKSELTQIITEEEANWPQSRSQHPAMVAPTLMTWCYDRWRMIMFATWFAVLAMPSIMIRTIVIASKIPSSCNNTLSKQLVISYYLLQWNGSLRLPWFSWLNVMYSRGYYMGSLLKWTLLLLGSGYIYIYINIYIYIYYMLYSVLYGIT